MPKIIVDEGEHITGKALEEIARFFNKLDDPYRMPQLMAEWLDQYNEQQKVDTFYQVPVGYSYNALALRFMFKKDMILMEFTLPDGTRLMELRLHK